MTRVTIPLPSLLLVLNMAMTLAASVPALMLQLPVPLQAPLQPAKLLPVAGVAVKTMLLLEAKLYEALVQDWSQ